MSDQWLPVDMGPGHEAGRLMSSSSFSINNLAPLLVNCFTLKRGDGYHLQKRPLLNIQTFAPAAGTFRGMHYWSATGKIYYAIGSGLYSVDPEVLGSITTLNTSLDTTSTFVGFAEMNTGSAKYLIVLDGVKGWYVTTSDVDTQITDSDFPTPHIPTPVCFDGYVFVAKSNSQDIYNSNVTDPTTWQASTFIRAEQFGGNITAIASQKNQLVVFQSNGITFFKNAGIASPNSPLMRMVELSVDIGVDYYYNVRRHSDSKIFFLGTGPSSIAKIYSMDNFQVQPIDAPIFEQIVNTYSEFSSFSVGRRLLSMEWFSQTFLLWEPVSTTASYAAALTMVINADNGQLSFWMQRDPASPTNPAFDTSGGGTGGTGGGSIGNHLPFGILEIVRIEDQFWAWNANASSNQLAYMTTGMLSQSAEYFSTSDKHSGATLGSVVNPNDRVTTTHVGYSNAKAVTGHATTGKYYFEMYIATNTTNDIGIGIAQSQLDATVTGHYVGEYEQSWGYWNGSGKVWNDAVFVGTVTAFTTGDIIGVAVDFDNSKLYFAKNGTWQNSGNPAAGTGWMNRDAYPSGNTLALQAGTWKPVTTAGALDSVVIRTSLNDFTQTIPSGYSAWG